MSRLPRHPRLWPRMKVRGRRRRALAAQRHSWSYFYPNMTVTKLEGGDDLTFGFDAAPPPPGPAGAAVAVHVIRTQDGLGRPAKRRPERDVVTGGRRTAKPAPAPAALLPREAGSIQFAPAGTDDWRPLGAIAGGTFSFTPDVTLDVTPLLTQPLTRTLEINLPHVNQSALRRMLMNDRIRET